jgi:hypothetical protein
MHQRCTQAAGSRRRSAHSGGCARRLAAHKADDGVWFNARAWIVTRRH